MRWMSEVHTMNGLLEQLEMYMLLVAVFEAMRGLLEYAFQAAKVGIAIPWMAWTAVMGVHAWLWLISVMLAKKAVGQSEMRWLVAAVAGSICKMLAMVNQVLELCMEVL